MNETLREDGHPMEFSEDDSSDGECRFALDITEEEGVERAEIIEVPRDETIVPKYGSALDIVEKRGEAKIVTLPWGVVRVHVSVVWGVVPVCHNVALVINLPLIKVMFAHN